MRIGACARTGFCCMLIPIAWSPRMLRDAHEAAVSGEADSVRIPEDVEILYPMLLDRCKGKRQMQLLSGEVEWRYIYGPCANLDWSIIAGALTSSCAIHDKKPRMCSEFPRYAYGFGFRETVAVGHHSVADNPGTFKGCGYNVDPRVGWDIETYTSDLTPLDPKEE